MPGHLRISALATVLSLEFPAQTPGAFIDAVTRAWSRCLVDDPHTAPSVEPLPVKAPDDDSDEAVRAAMQRLSQDVTHRLIAAQTGRLLMFHAGAVSDPSTGATLVYVAPSGTGKTTLSRLLGRTHGYLTDETVGIDPATGRVHPYPKPLSVAHGEWWRKVETSPDELGLLPAHREATVARIVLLSREEGESQPVSVEELGTLDAIVAIVSETSASAGCRVRCTPCRPSRPHRALLRLSSRGADLVPVAEKLIEGSA